MKMRMKFLCLVISLITLITLTSCGSNQSTTPHNIENHNTTPTDTVTTPSVEATTPSVEVTTPSVDISDAVLDEFIASCNMNSGGYINFLNGKYYYRNTADNGSLYVSDADGKNAVCIDRCTDETILCICVDETAVYYLKRTKLDAPLEFNNSSVTYSVAFEGQLRRFCDGNVTVLSEENVLSYALSKDYIFYATADLKVFRMKHDGTEKTAILELSNPMTISVSGNKLYLHRDEEIITADFDGKNSHANRIYLFAPAFNESTMYFINLNGSNLCKTELSDKDAHAAIDNTQAVIGENVRSYTVYNGRLVYERMHTSEIVIADMNGDNPKVVCTGKSPIALNGYLFYLDNGIIRVADIFEDAQNFDISSLPLDEAYAYAVKQYKEHPESHRDICALQPETQQIIEIGGKYYQSYVAANVDIRYIWISQPEFPDERAASWDWYTVGTATDYSLELLGKIDQGRKD